jgi:hypothetical protein
MMKTYLVFAVALLCAVSSLAAEPAPKLTKPGKAPKIQFDVPKFEAIPNGELKSAAPVDAASSPSKKRSDEAVSLVSILHARSFIRTPAGAAPSAPFAQVKISAGNPFQTEKFSTVVRVKNPSKRRVSVEVAILDARGDTAMEAKGQLAFQTEVAEWTADWEATNVRGPGEYQVLVRLDGNPQTPTPLKLEQ